MEKIKLKHCKYPTAEQTHLHGLQRMPRQLPLARILTTDKHLVVASDLTMEQLQEMIWLVAESFALKEPMTRYLTNKNEASYSKKELIALFVTNYVITKEDVMRQSLAIVKNFRVVGGAFNETLVTQTAIDIPTRKLEKVFDFLSPIFEVFDNQQNEAIPYLISKVSGFEKALTQNLVGHHFMVARSDQITGDKTFSLVAGTMTHYQELGFEFVITEATNTWTGAAIEKLGGVRVHFHPYRNQIRPGISPDGYLSDKDSGSMLYVLRLN